MENEESLKTYLTIFAPCIGNVIFYLKAGALVSKFADAVQDDVDDLLAYSIMTASIVVGGVLLAGDELFRMKKLAVRAGADLV